MRPKEPDHVWMVERKLSCYANWHCIGFGKTRNNARIIARDMKRRDWGAYFYRIRKYIPVNKLSMEMVVK